MSELSRRNLLARVSIAAAAVPIATLPALPEHLSQAASSKPAVSKTVEPTAIAKLWNEHKKLGKKYDRVRRRVEVLLQEINDRVGQIDPAIMYGEESDSLGINNIAAGHDDYIRSLYIEGAITRIEFAAKIGVEKVEKNRPLSGEWDLLEDKDFKLTETQLAHHQRLTEILEISREREERIKKLRRETGWDDLNEKMDELCSQQCKVAARILKTNSAAPSDFTIKFAINKRYEDNWAADSIMRDIRNLMKRPAILAQALEQAA